MSALVFWIDPGPQKVPPPAYAPQEQPDQPQCAPTPTYTADINSPQSVYPPQGGYVPLGVCHQQPGAVIMTAPATTVIVRASRIQPQDYFSFAIIVTIFCFFPFGIVAIIKSVEVRRRFVSGDIAGARMASGQAKMWSGGGLVIGLVVQLIIWVIAILLSQRYRSHYGYYNG